MSDTLTFTIRRSYRRDTPAGRFPRITGGPGLEANRLGLCWRPLIDLGDSDLASDRLRLFAVVNDAVAAGEPSEVLWLSRIGVAGLRQQVLRHAGLDELNAATPAELPEQFWTPRWRVLVGAVEDFGALPDLMKAAVVFHLVQLSYCHLAVHLGGSVPFGEGPGTAQLAYQTARALGRIPGQSERARTLFLAVAERAPEEALRVLAIGQATAVSARDYKDAIQADHSADLAGSTGEADASWHLAIARSRLHRAAALARLIAGEPDGMRDELEHSQRWHTVAERQAATAVGRIATAENARILLETRIKGAARTGGADRAQLAAWCDELGRIDPNCLDQHLVVGDGRLAAGDLRAAADAYAAAGVLGTGDGALGWYRAGQVYDHLGDPAAALHAMGRCLELDASAVEPREYMENAHAVPQTTR